MVRRINILVLIILQKIEFEVRAAIMEFDGNMKAELAATLAFNDITKNYAYLKEQIK